jgi:hypothetical protein
MKLLPSGVHASEPYDMVVENLAGGQYVHFECE